MIARAADWYWSRPLHVQAWIALGVIGPVIVLW